MVKGHQTCLLLLYEAPAVPLGASNRATYLWRRKTRENALSGPDLKSTVLRPKFPLTPQMRSIAFTLSYGLPAHLFLHPALKAALTVLYSSLLHLLTQSVPEA